MREKEALISKTSQRNQATKKIVMEDAEDTLRLKFRKRKSNRRSSILKPTPVALLELDPNKQSDEDLTVNTRKSRRSSKRVSFSATCQVKEFQKDGPLKRQQQAQPPPAIAREPAIDADANSKVPSGVSTLNTLINGPIQDDVFSPVEDVPHKSSVGFKSNPQPSISDVGIIIPPKNFSDEQGTVGGIYSITNTTDFQTVNNTSVNKFVQKQWDKSSFEHTRLFQDDGDMEMTECLSEKMNLHVSSSQQVNSSKSAIRKGGIVDSSSALSRIISGGAFPGSALESPENTDKVDTSSALSRILSGGGALSESPFTSPENTDKVDTSDALSRIMSGGPFPPSSQLAIDAESTDQTLKKVSEHLLDSSNVLARLMSGGKPTSQVDSVQSQGDDNVKSLGDKTVFFSDKDNTGSMDFTTCLTANLSTTQLMKINKSIFDASCVFPGCGEDMDFTACVSQVTDSPAKLDASNALSRIESSCILGASKNESNSVERKSISEQNTTSSGKLGTVDVLSRLMSGKANSSSQRDNLSEEIPTENLLKVDSKSFLEKLSGMNTTNFMTSPSEKASVSQGALTCPEKGNRTQMFQGDDASLELTGCVTSNITQQLTATTKPLTEANKSGFNNTKIFGGDDDDMEFTACLTSKLPDFQTAQFADASNVTSKGSALNVTNTAGANTSTKQPIEESDSKQIDQEVGNQTHLPADGDPMEMTACLTGFPPLINTNQEETLKSINKTPSYSTNFALGDRTRLFSQGSDDMELTAQIQEVILSGPDKDLQHKENTQLPKPKPSVTKPTRGLRLRSPASEKDSPKETAPATVPPETERVGLSDITHQYKTETETKPDTLLQRRSRFNSGSETESDCDLICPDDGVPIKMVGIEAPRITKDGCIYTQATFDPSVKFLGNLAPCVSSDQSGLEPILEASRETSNVSQTSNESKIQTSAVTPNPSIPTMEEKKFLKPTSDSVAEGNKTHIFNSEDDGMEMTSCVGGLLDKMKGVTSEIEKGHIDGNDGLGTCVSNTTINSNRSILGTNENADDQKQSKLAAGGNAEGMDFATCVGGILDQTNASMNRTKIGRDGNTDRMDFTTCGGGILDQTKANMNQTKLTGDGMEFTTCLGGIMDQTKANMNRTKLTSDGPTDNMEFTTCMGGILDQTKASMKQTKMSGDGNSDGMNFTICGGGILDQTKASMNQTKLPGDGMEFTTCLGGIMDQTKAHMNQTKMGGDGNTDSMNFTTCGGGILDETKANMNQTKLTGDGPTDKMDFTTCMGGILDQTKASMTRNKSEDAKENAVNFKDGIQEKSKTILDKTTLASDNNTGGMDFTTCGGRILDQTKASMNRTKLTGDGHTDKMDFTTCVGGILDKTKVNLDRTKLTGDGLTDKMDFTSCGGGILDQTKANMNRTKFTGDDLTGKMDFTTCVGGILDKTKANMNRTKLTGDGLTGKMDFTTCQGGILDQTRETTEKTKEEVEMDFTTCAGGIMDRTKGSSSRTQIDDDGSPDGSEVTCGGILEQTNSLADKTKLGPDGNTGMEFTTCVGGILDRTKMSVNRTQFGDDGITGGMDFTICRGGILNQTSGNLNKTKLAGDGSSERMDLASCRGGILNQTSAAADKTKLGSDGDNGMDFTTCTGGILDQTKASMNRTKFGGDDNEDGMDFTSCAGRILDQTKSEIDTTKLEKSNLSAGSDLLSCGSKIVEQSTSNINKSKQGSAINADVMEFNRSGEILDQSRSASNEQKVVHQMGIDQPSLCGMDPKNILNKANKCHKAVPLQHSQIMAGEIEDGILNKKNTNALPGLDATANLVEDVRDNVIENDQQIFEGAKPQSPFVHDEQRENIIVRETQKKQCNTEDEPSLNPILSQLPHMEKQPSPGVIASMKPTDEAIRQGRAIEGSRSQSIVSSVKLSQSISLDKRTEDKPDNEMKMSPSADLSMKRNESAQMSDSVFAISNAKRARLESGVSSVGQDSVLHDIDSRDRNKSSTNSLWGDLSMELVSAYDCSFSKEDKLPGSVPAACLSDDRPVIQLSTTAEVQMETGERTDSNMDKLEGSLEVKDVMEKSVEDKSMLRPVATGAESMKQSILKPVPSPVPGSLSLSSLSGIGVLPDSSLQIKLTHGMGTSHISLVDMEDDAWPKSIDDYLHMLNPLFSTYLSGDSRRSTIAPVRVEPPTCEAEIFQIRFIEAPMVELLNNALEGREEEEERIKEAVHKLEAELMNDLPVDFLEIPEATQEKRTNLVKKYRNMYKACSNKSKAALKSRKLEFTTALMIRYQSQIEEAAKMKSEIVDKMELAAEVKQLVEQVKSELAEHYAKQKEKRKSIEEANLSAYDQKIAELTEDLGAKQQELDTITQQRLLAQERESKLHSDLKQELVKLIPQGQRMSSSKLQRLCAWCKKISTPDMYSATFLFGTLRVQMKYDAEQEGSPMTDLEVISQLADNAADYAHLAHRYVHKGFNLHSFRRTHPSKDDLNSLLINVATVVTVAANIADDVMCIKVGHQVSVDDLRISVDFVSLALHTKFKLIMTLDPQTYPTHGCQWDLVQIIGSISEKDISAAIGRIPPGLSYLLRLVTEIDYYIEQKSGKGAQV